MVTLTNKQNVVFCPNRYVGLSTDEKPMPGGEFRVNTGDEFIEMDTSTVYWFNETYNVWLKGEGIPSGGSTVGTARVGNSVVSSNI